MRESLRVKVIPFVLALTAAAFASVLVAPAASAHIGTGAITCNSVTFAYTRFPTATNTISSETVTIDGVTAVSKTFTFVGTAGTDVVPIAFAPGTHTVTAFAQWKVHRVRSFTVTQTITCGGIG